MIDLYETYWPVVTRVTTQVASSYPDYVSAEDVASELWLYIYANPTAMDQLAREPRWELKIAATLRRRAHTFCLKEEASVNGYALEDQFNYPIELVRELLEIVWDYKDWTSFGQTGDGQPTGKKDPAHGNDKLAMLADVRSALQSIPPEQFKVLAWTYKFHMTASAIADELGVSEDAAKKRVQRAVGAVQRTLGRRDLADLRRSYSGRSGPRSSAEGRARLEQDYDG